MSSSRLKAGAAALITVAAMWLTSPAPHVVRFPIVAKHATIWQKGHGINLNSFAQPDDIAPFRHGEWAFRYYRNWTTGTTQMMDENWPDIQHIPTIWCTHYRDPVTGEPDETDIISQAHDPKLRTFLSPHYVGYLIALNEPDFRKQCNIPVHEAVEAYYRVRSEWPNAQLIIPHVSSTASGERERDYVKRWCNSITNEPMGLAPDIEAVGMSLYGDYETNRRNLLLMIDTVDEYCGDGIDVVVVEWGVNNNRADVSTTVDKMKAMIESNERVLFDFYYTMRQCLASERGDNGCPTGENLDTIFDTDVWAQKSLTGVGEALRGYVDVGKAYP